MDLINRIQLFYQHHSLLNAQSTLVIGLSGGPDSVFLLHVLHAVSKREKITLVAAHLDHEWRINSSQDVQFCQNLCDQLGIKLYIQKISQLGISLNSNGSQEELARRYRRHFFEQIKTLTGATSIALAHHANDQEETFFIRLIRGASLAGLTGMKPREGDYIRPLLAIHKEEIVAYLKNHAIPYLIDPTNNTHDYLRNKIRAVGIPALKECDKRLSTNLARTLEQLQATESFLCKLTTTTYQAITQSNNGIKELNLEQFQTLDEIMKDRILIHWLIDHQASFSPSQGLLKEIKRFFGSSRSNKHRMHIAWILHKNKGFISLVKLPGSDNPDPLQKIFQSEDSI